MSASKVPRYLLFAVILGLAVAGIMLSMFHGQNRWLANEIVNRSSLEHTTFLETNFRAGASQQLAVIAATLANDIDRSDNSAMLQALNRSLIYNETMTGLRFRDADNNILQAGNLPAVNNVDDVTWLENSLVLSQSVVAEGNVVGTLTGAFELDALRAESRSFSDNWCLPGLTVKR